MATSSSALTLSGTSSMLDSNEGTIYDLNGTDFTIGCWIRADAFSNIYAINSICGTHNGASAGYIYYLDNSGNQAYTVVGIGTIATSGISLSTGTWYFIALAYDNGTNMTFHRMTQAGVMSTEVESVLTTTAGADFTIGEGGSGVATLFEFDGIISHFQVWDRLLSTSEIYNAAYRPGSVTQNLLSYWPIYGQLDPDADNGPSDINLTPTGDTQVTTAVPGAMPQGGYL